MFSPIVMYTAVLLGSFLLLQLVVDGRRSGRTMRVKRHLLVLARKQHAKSVSVVVELRRSATTILPFLDYLYEQDYAKLEVIVVVKQTAGSKARTTLENYRRRNKQAKLRIIKHRKGMGPERIASTYASNELIMWLNGSEKLSKDFFTEASLEFVDPKLMALQPRTHIALDNTLITAFRSLFSLWINYARILRGSLKLDAAPMAGVVYRRQAVKKEFVQTADYSSSVAVAGVYQPIKATTRHRLAELAVLAGLAVAISAAYLFMPHDQFVFFLAISAGLYCLVCWLWIIGVAEYSVLSRINLVLVTPFSLLAFTIRLVVDNLLLLRPSRLRAVVLRKL